MNMFCNIPTGWSTSLHLDSPYSITSILLTGYPPPLNPKRGHKLLLVVIKTNLYNAHVSPPAKHSKSPVLYASSFAQLCPTTLWPHGLQPSRLLCPCDSAGKNTGVDCHFLLQGIFPAQRQNPHLLSLLHWQAGSSPLSHLGSPLLFYMELIWILHDKEWISPFFF